MAKSRNNLLGVGGQRKKLSRSGAQGAGPAGEADRRTAADQKQELLRKMRERAEGPAQPDAADADASAAEPEAPAQN
ncbi:MULTISPECIES: DUF6243 family protein [unclassified Streptomyces]|uniref:DUF6243 family protein n=1 Tax=unclassified Streptomyces TaxID=2593676 RepID=UPI002E2DA64C|nr:DUF6243 family protein [Streptomyces sp. NBC_01423]WSX90871.1 DUF6243 family protein [Streptomyces sp. NBC_00891]WSY05350.1 DUF6243 family protein [Streptomyces sp. NBC_00890]WSZ06974.1 DUF6243 family protein [Streptomyces sp. NBC_00869]WSZ25528.1 DUF6243 family protein [Streptomyces sp. NBC_00870]